MISQHIRINNNITLFLVLPMKTIVEPTNRIISTKLVLYVCILVLYAHKACVQLKLKPKRACFIHHRIVYDIA